MGEVAIIALLSNLDAARKIQEFIGCDVLTYSQDSFKQAFEEYNSIIAIMAAGIAVRNIAPLMRDKWKDPAVVVVDFGLNFAIPILGGHHGGNDLAKKLAGLGITPVITTATELKGRESVEKIAENLGCRVVNKNSTKKVNAAVLKKNRLVVGIGANRGVTKDEVMLAITSALSELNAGVEDVKCFASAKIKEKEKGIIDASKELGKEIRFVSHEAINSIKAPSSSKAKSLGLNGVCEPAALALSDEKKLLLKKRIYGNVTIAIAR